MLHVVAIMAVAAAAAAVGQLLVKKGMGQVGPLEWRGPGPLVAYFWDALRNPWVVGGTVCNALFYFLFLGALSWADVTVALPLTALEFLFAAVLAVALLGEKVPPTRWIGIAFVVCGVVLVSRGGGET